MLFDLVVDVLLDDTLRLGRGFRDVYELLIVALPGVCREQLFRKARTTGRDGLLDIRDDAGHLVLRAQLGGADTLRLRENRGEEAIEREENTRRHAGKEHQPKHGIPEDDADDLDVRTNDVARCIKREERDEQQARSEHQKFVAGG